MFSGASAAADSRDAGLDDQDARDYAYDSALIDAYWYHVRRDPQDPANMQLVRERLCAPKLARDIATGTWDPADARIGGSVCSGDSQTTREIVVLTDYVVDFQIWFDCGDGTNGLVENVNWSNDWSPPDNVGTCMDDSDPKWGLARVGHLRVSLRTARERKNLRHIQFEDRTGALCDPDAPAACAGVTGEGLNLRTFDAYPTVEGAAQVVTLQSDFVLPNFVNRNATRDIDAVFNP